MTDKELLYSIEKAATSLLSDEEICISLGISQEQLLEHYDIVERTRIQLKQKLNAKRISDAATQGGNVVNQIISNIPKVKKSNKGGYRPGAGRPQGSGNKITARDLLDQCQQVIGKPFATSLLEGYRDSIESGDTKLRQIYEKMILDKTASTLIESEVIDPEITVESKKKAFIEAVSLMNNINKNQEE